MLGCLFLRLPARAIRCGWVASAALALAALRVLADAPVSVFVELEGPALAQLGSSERRLLASTTSLRQSRRLELARQHADLEARLPADAELVGRHATLLNAVALRLPAGRVDDLRRLPGVVAVTPSLRFRQQAATLGDARMIQAADLWRRAISAGHLAGQGMKIGIIDGGIDYYHAHFGGTGASAAVAGDNPRVLEAGSFPTAKVAGGWDFVGDNYDPFGSSSSARTPRPDPDPIDSYLRYHGTHVAGIAAGYGVTADGRTFRGDYATLGDVSGFRIPPGIAPEARLYSLKVFGAGDVDASPVVSALEWALDPDQDGDFGDRLDVVNLSLSTTFGYDFANRTWETAVNRLVAQGVVVVGSSGNGGDTAFVTGPPALAERAISVAATAGDQFHQNLATFHGLVERPWTIPDLFDTGVGPLLADVPPVSARLVAANPLAACTALVNSDALRGQVALVQADSCGLLDKVRRVQSAGAVAVLLILPHDGVFADYRSLGAPADLRIPVLGINQRLGRAIMARSGTALSVNLRHATARTDPDWIGRPAHFSSRGPSLAIARLKPDIAAPGYGILSARAATGSGVVPLSGTSMSAPQVAGAAALVRQAHPDWSPEDVKAALMNTALPLRDPAGRPYPHTWTGAGLVQAMAAVDAPLMARVDDDSGQVSLSFGLLDIAEPAVRTRSLRIVNRQAREATVRIAVSNAVEQAGARLIPALDSVVLPPGGFARVDLRLEVVPLGMSTRLAEPDPAGAGLTQGVHPRRQPRLPEAGGEVWVTDATSGAAVHLPWLVVVKPRTSFDHAAARVGLPSSRTSTIPLPTRGDSGHESPLVAALLWGASSSRIAAVGAASDFHRTEALGDTTLYFGLALAAPWLTPQHPLVGASIEIDLNDDARVDFTLLNGNESGLVYLDPLSHGPLGEVDDDFQTVLRDDNKRTNNLSSAGPLNVLPPAYRDTAPMLASTLLHSVRASSLGLSTNRSRFRYRGSYNSGAERTAWVAFDARVPVVDATPHGLRGTPFQDEGRGVKVDFNRIEAAARGFTFLDLPRVLLLHFHNATSVVESVVLDIVEPDVDRDGLPDVWELAHLGDLAGGGSLDSDGDGKSDVEEYLAGTDPAALRLEVRREPGLELVWASVAGRRYTVERAGDVGGRFEAWLPNLPATPPRNAVPLKPGVGPSFLRLRLE